MHVFVQALAWVDLDPVTPADEASSMVLCKHVLLRLSFHEGWSRYKYIDWIKLLFQQVNSARRSV